jgi:hypothetical protein
MGITQARGGCVSRPLAGLDFVGDQHLARVVIETSSSTRG